MPHSPGEQVRHRGDWRVDVAFATEPLQRVDRVPLLHDLASRMQGGSARNPRLFPVLSELISKALDH